jgi:drug/metabolite transporter (DMT)-like permease
MIWVFILFGLFAGSFSLSKVTLNYGDPIFSVGYRMLLAGFLLLSCQVFCNRQKFEWRTLPMRTLLLLGIINIYLPNLMEISAMRYMTSTKVCLLYSFSPFLAALMSYYTVKEKLGWRKLLGLLIGFLGILPSIMADSGTGVELYNFSWITIPEMLVLLSVLCSVHGWLILQKLVVKNQLSPIIINGVSMFIGGIIALLHSYIAQESWDPFPINNVELFLRNTFFLCLISNIIGYNLYGYLLKRFSATFMAFAGLITPVFASIIGWYFLREPISGCHFISVLIFCLGLVIFYNEEFKGRKNATI